MREMISVVCIQVKKIVLVSETKMVQMRRFRRDFSWPIFLNYMPIVMQISKFENWTYCFCSPAAKMMHICWCCWIAQCVCNQHINTSLNYGDVLKFCVCNSDCMMHHCYLWPEQTVVHDFLKEQLLLNYMILYLIIYKQWFTLIEAI